MYMKKLLYLSLLHLFTGIVSETPKKCGIQIPKMRVDGGGVRKKASRMAGGVGEQNINEFQKPLNYVLELIYS